MTALAPYIDCLPGEPMHCSAVQCSAVYIDVFVYAFDCAQSRKTGSWSIYSLGGLAQVLTWSRRDRKVDGKEQAEFACSTWACLSMSISSTNIFQLPLLSQSPL